MTTDRQKPTSSLLYRRTKKALGVRALHVHHHWHWWHIISCLLSAAFTFISKLRCCRRGAHFAAIKKQQLKAAGTRTEDFDMVFQYPDVRRDENKVSVDIQLLTRALRPSLGGSASDTPAGKRHPTETNNCHPECMEGKKKRTNEPRNFKRVQIGSVVLPKKKLNTFFF